MASTQKGSGVKGLIVVVISLIGMIVVAELALQLLQASGFAERTFKALGQAKPPLDRKDGPGMYYMHPYNGYRLKPGYVRGDIEKINSLGFRGNEFSLEKPDDTYRIVVMGGSTTFAVYLPWHESAPYFMERDLRNRFQTDNIEVINGGLTGSTTAETVHRLISQVLEVDPDMVVIYHGYNDLFPRLFNDWENDYYHFRDADPANPPGMTRFITYRLLLAALSPGAFHENYDLANLVWKTQNLPASDTDRMQNYLDTDNSAFRHNIEAAVQLLQARGVQPVLATFAADHDIWHWNDHIPPYLWELGIEEHNDVIRSLAEQYDVPLVPFAESTRGWRPLYNDSIHMTNYGNKFKAMVFDDTIAPFVEEKLGKQAGEGVRYSPKAPYESTRAYRLFGNRFKEEYEADVGGVGGPLTPEPDGYLDR